MTVPESALRRTIASLSSLRACEALTCDIEPPPHAVQVLARFMIPVNTRNYCLASDSSEKKNIQMQFRTTDYITRFELARLLGVRILQIEDHNLQVAGGPSPEEMAIAEIVYGTNPAIIRRYLDDGTHEDRKVSELKMDTRMLQYQLRQATGANQLQGQRVRPNGYAK